MSSLTRRYFFFSSVFLSFHHLILVWLSHLGKCRCLDCWRSLSTGRQFIFYNKWRKDATSTSPPKYLSADEMVAKRCLAITVAVARRHERFGNNFLSWNFRLFFFLFYQRIDFFLFATRNFIDGIETSLFHQWQTENLFEIKFFAVRSTERSSKWSYWEMRAKKKATSTSVGPKHIVLSHVCYDNRNMENWKRI